MPEVGVQVELIGVPIDMGAGRRGVDMGPSAIRYAGLQAALHACGLAVFDQGNLPAPVMETCQAGDSRLRYLDCIVPLARRVMGAVAAALRRNRFPLVLGGDHSLSLGSLRGAARHKRLGVIWIDAHADFNTPETTPSGNIHGMPLAALAGLGDPRLVELDLSAAAVGTPVVSPANIAIVGVRDLDPGERSLLKQHGVHVYGMDLIDRQGMHQVMLSAIQAASQGMDGLYLSFDLDSIDPEHAPGVGTAVRGGLTYREAHLACELLAESGLLVGMDLVEVNPILDERNRTALLAVELALSALGKRVW